VKKVYVSKTFELIEMKDSTNGSVVQDVDGNEEVDGNDSKRHRPCSYNFKEVRYYQVKLKSELELESVFVSFLLITTSKQEKVFKS